MSTILDALRKVEEEKRTQVTDVRTRLLSTSPRFDFRTPRRSRLPWIVGGGLVFSGIALGAGLMLWRISDIPSVKEEVSLLQTPQVASISPQQQPAGQRVQSQVPPEPQARPTSVPLQASTQDKKEAPDKQPQVAQITPHAAVELPPAQPQPPVPPPVVQSHVVASTAVPNVARPSEESSAWTGGLTPGAAANVAGQQRPEAPQPASATVQRSPFELSSPYDRIVAPPPLPPPSAPPRVATAPKPSVRRSSALEKSSQSPAAVVENDAAEKETRPRTVSSPTSAPEETPGSPPGASLSFLQWSADPEKRVASIKVGTGPATIAHEGDSIDGMTIVKIRPDAVELRSGDSHYVLKAR